MKKILGLAAFFLTLMLCGCDEEGTYKEPATLKLIKSDVLFNAMEAEGTIVAETGGTLTALSDQSWCTTSVSGNTVTVKVSRNSDINGRYAILKLSDGERSTSVSVSQQGMHLNVDKNHLIISDKGGDASIVYTANHPVVISSLEGGDGWLTMKASDKTVSFTANPIRNDYYGLREATMTITATLGNGTKITETVKISQARPLTYEDMLEGDWKFSYTNLEGQRITGSLARLQANGEDKTSFQFLGALSSATAFPTLYFDPAIGTVKFKAGFVITSANILGVILEGIIVAGDSEGTIDDFEAGNKAATRLPSVEYEGRINTLAPKNSVKFVFGDNGTWPGKVVRGLDRAWIINGVLSDILFSYYDCELYRE